MFDDDNACLLFLPTATWTIFIVLRIYYCVDIEKNSKTYQITITLSKWKEHQRKSSSVVRVGKNSEKMYEATTASASLLQGCRYESEKQTCTWKMLRMRIKCCSMFWHWYVNVDNAPCEPWNRKNSCGSLIKE